MLKRSQSRETSIFSYKPTHFRVKTESDPLKENQSSERNSSIKKPLHKYTNSEFQTNFSQKSSNHNQQLNKLSAERSIFGQMNFRKPKFQKQKISTSQLQHPLKEYIDTVKQRKINRSIRRYKTSCEAYQSLSKQCTQNLTMIPFRRLQSEEPSQVTIKEHYILFKLIDQIYDKINKFKEVGYTQKKINEWIQKYCLHKRKYMTKILMKSSNKHKFSQTIQDYSYERDPRKVKQKLLTVKKKINGKQKLIDQYDLVEFANYIEEILIQKNKIKISQLKNSISEKLQECFIYNRQKNQCQFGKKFYPADLLNFVSDLNEIQYKHGNFNNISTFNREYFTDLGIAEKDIRTKIYQLLKVTESNKIANQDKEMQKISTLKFQKNNQNSSSTIRNRKAVEVTDLQIP